LNSRRAVLSAWEKALRRLPVVDDGRLVGVVSLGDLAVERDPHSALGEISAAQPNR
jgi:signal-transduction protein with cAMP-binding, CBS, and nucleotidyltransferase domain